MNLFKTILFIIFFILCNYYPRSCYSKSSYYISNTGNDINSGKTPEQSWRTLNKINSYSFSPGDSILFKRGDKWSGKIISQSGDSSGCIIYGAYGTGDKPILCQSLEITNWIEESPNVWRSIGQGVYGKEIFSNKDISFNPDNWELIYSTNANASISKSDKEYNSAPYGLKIECKKNGDSFSDIKLQTINTINIEAGKIYELSFYAKSSKSFETGPIYLNNCNATCSQIYFSDCWTKKRIQFRATMKTKKGGIKMLFGRNFPEGEILYIDDISLKEFEYRSFSDVGNIIFNHGESCGNKVWEKKDLNKQGDFFYDNNEQCVKIYSTISPDIYYYNIQCTLSDHIISESGKSYIVYENLAIKNGGAHGIGGGNTHHITIRNCDISYIGGGQQPCHGNGRVRYGNGVEFWADAHDNLVENCRIWEIYDAALTNQAYASIQYNIVYRNNVVWNSEYSFEFFNTQGTTKNIQFINNTCINAGHGWGHITRPSPTGRHICIWECPIKASDIIIENNIFYEACQYPLYIPKGNLSPMKIDYNCWYQENKNFANFKTGNYKKEEFTKYKSKTGFDTNSIMANPRFINILKNNYQLNEDSPCIDKGNPSFTFVTDDKNVDMGALMRKNKEQ